MKPILVGDIGGTNARFALLAGGKLGPVERTAVPDHPSLAAAIDAFLVRQGGRHTIAGMALAVAGPIEGGRCALTNSPWVVDETELRNRFQVEPVRIVNDFEATAWSLARLEPKDLLSVGGGPGIPGAPAVVLGPGTGLGVACSIPLRGGTTVLATEGGHATLPAVSAREDAVVERLRERFEHVSIERALSGDGLVNLYLAIAALDGTPAPDRSAAEVTGAALDGSCPSCAAALGMFCAMMGTVAGNLALTFGARGGVYIAGGIVPRFAAHLARTAFRERFEAKGRFHAYLRKIPVWVILHPDPTLLGLIALAAPVP